VKEPAVAPFTAVESAAAVAEAVVYSAVEADVRPPISGVPAIKSIHPAPVAGGPEKTWCGSRNPGAGNPVIAIVAPSPVTRGPHVARLRANWLYVDGQRRRANR